MMFRMPLLLVMSLSVIDEVAVLCIITVAPWTGLAFESKIFTVRAPPAPADCRFAGETWPVNATGVKLPWQEAQAMSTSTVLTDA